MTYQAGQKWSFRAPQGFEDSRIIIGAIVTLGEGQRIICFSVTRAPRKMNDGTIAEAMISFLALSESAFRDSVADLDGNSEPPPEFSEELVSWRDDTRGLTVFTVPFEGCLDELLATQAAALIARSAA